MTLVVRWRKSEPPVLTRWRGPEAMPDPVAWSDPLPIAAIIGPRGPIGEPGPEGPTLTPGDGIDVVGTEIRIDIGSLPTAP